VNEVMNCQRKYLNVRKKKQIKEEKQHNLKLETSCEVDSEKGSTFSSSHLLLVRSAISSFVHVSR
jgi:hypothetical protein